MSILGLDIGTTGVKAVAFREDGDLITSSYREYALHSPSPGHLELEPHEVLAAIRTVIGEVSSQTTSDPIRSLATSTLGEAAVPVDERGQILGGAIIGFDSRGDEEMREFSGRISNERVFELTGHSINSYHTLFKVMWRRRHDPEVFRRARRYLCFGDFTAASLGLEPRVDHSMAARTLAFDIHRREFSPELFAAADLPESVFAAPVAPGDPVGAVGDNDFGLPRGCVVAGGLHDQPAGILGSGTRPGEAMMAIGTVICLGVHLRGFPEDPSVLVENNLACYPTYGTDQYVSLAFNFTGGSLLKWYRDQLGASEVRQAREEGVDPYEVICRGVPDQPTDLVVLPHFTTTGTPWLDTRALGAILGLRLTTRREEIARAIIEGVLMEIRLNTELLADADVDVELFKAIGGAARSEFWMQTAADVLDRPVAVLSVREGASLGVALMGALAAGIVSSEAEIQEIVSRSARVRKVFEPRPEWAKRYAERYAIYRDVYPATRDISHRICSLGR